MGTSDRLTAIPHQPRGSKGISVTQHTRETMLGR